MENKTFSKHYYENKQVGASPDNVFAYLDDHSRLSSHMSTSSWMMGGGHMETTIDELGGQKVGSHIRLSGKAFGMSIALDEVVTCYEPPHKKIWETVGTPKLLVIGHYRLGIEIIPHNGTSDLCVFIDYDLPLGNAWLGHLFGKMYAKWCVRQMLYGVSSHFNSANEDQAPMKEKINQRSVLYGILAAAALLGVYFGILSLVSGWSYAQSQFADQWYFIVSLVAGFGIQIALYQYIKSLVHEGRGMGKVVGVSGTTSTAAMVSCCAHYLVNLVPILGITGLVTLIAQYQITIYWIGLAFNLFGIMFISSKIIKFKKDHG